MPESHSCLATMTEFLYNLSSDQGQFRQESQEPPQTT
ncbi:unnamed protein product [Gulo gulo]|uniref:Uncharacterized protein n=1 Tax=Gulo gulo TaxID=48420 RepID=A0A9X9LRC4_GULGU|nr:unnamed protein product [Gulo gulo]